MDENEKALLRFAAINYIDQLHAQGFSLERTYLLVSQKSWGGVLKIRLLMYLKATSEGEFNPQRLNIRR